MPLLTQNSELRPHLIWNWSIPALTAKLADGRRISTCPSAGICAQLCYARNGTYLFSNVLAAHTRNLQLVIDDRDEWRRQMICELGESRFTKSRPPRVLPIERHDIADDWLRTWADTGAPAIRIHDAGDFFADWYLHIWLDIARANPRLLFYAYTKEITMLRSVTDLPQNFRWLASTGGTQDHLITDDQRHADVFPTDEALTAAGYTSQDASDLLCVLLPTTRIGIPANRIKHFTRRMAGRTFSEIQRTLHT
ncbi:MAG: hypothetical protein EBS84_21175 [Proteobacteria bacterium]|nr:hypothetical protein [Verrucomicrobiota bacterium]NBU11486.1 hypothetical protein [Pseudomonadota bacterium]NDE96860.1 hypothetical protein [Verrucomicrobiota bacterium]